jgi:hypothetical protein
MFALPAVHGRSSGLVIAGDLRVVKVAAKFLF